jgi:N-acetylmuramoyl-L-alanine amidase
VLGGASVMRHTLLQLLASILLCNTLISTTLSADESGNYVESTNYQVIKNKSLIEITFSQRTNYKHDQLQNPYRIYFDMEVKDIDKKLIALIDAINKQTGLITKAVIAKNKPDIVRTNTRISGDNKGIKIIASQSEIPDLIDNFYQAEATQTKNKIWEKEKYVIAIDAGHGGKDPGAVGRKGTTEKSVNLSIARRLKKLIDKEKNMQAVLTRNNDVYVKLSDRIKKIRKYQPTIFISIHADAAENRKASGSSVFILPRKDEVASSRYAKLIAEKENEMDLLFDPDIDNRDKDTQKTILD